MAMVQLALPEQIMRDLRSRVGANNGIISMLIDAVGMAINVFDGAETVLGFVDALALRRLLLRITQEMDRAMDEGKKNSAWTLPSNCHDGKRRRHNSGPGDDGFGSGGFPPEGGAVSVVV